MGKVKPAIYRGSYHVQSRRMNQAAQADPTATCWRDGHTLAEHGPNAAWSCGHVDNLALYLKHPSPHARYIDGRLCAPEIRRCNYSHGETTATGRVETADPNRWW